MLSPTNSFPSGVEYAMLNTNGWVARSPQGAIQKTSIPSDHGRDGNDIEFFSDADTPTGRLYAFKLGFARQMVKTHGCFRDYERLRKVEEEAVAALA